ncbi:hypothetical protein ACFLZ1_03945 [Patescibacteria group bacterium]
MNFFKKHFFQNIKRKKGTILMEALLALAIGSAVLAAVSQALIGGQQANLNSFQHQKAEYFLIEAQEAVKSLWREGWDNINVTGVFHPEVIANNWSLQAGEETRGIYTRTVGIEEVSRDLQGNIATQEGVLDPSVKRITVNVDWNAPGLKSISSTIYLTRYLDNASFREDTLADFIDGFEDATDVTTSPGNVQLAQTGGGGWTEPGSIGTVDCSDKIAGGWATEEYLYVALDKLAGGVEVFDLTDPGPATPSSIGEFETLSRGNDLAVTEDGLAYIAHSTENPSVSVYDVSVDPVNPTFLGWSNITHAAEGIWVTTANIFIAVKDTNNIAVYERTADPINLNFLDVFDTQGTVRDVAVTGNYLYVAQSSTAEAVEIFDISTSVSSPTSVGIISSLYEPTGIWAEASTLYLSLNGKRGAMYNLSPNPIVPRILGIFYIERNTSDVAAFNDYGYIFGTDSQLKAIEVIYVADSKGSSGVYFVYGEYTSSTFDAGQEVAFNRISWHGDEPANTNILFQVALNNDNLTWNFVGPDGTATSHYEDSGAFALTNVLGRYFQYKIILTGDGDTTPVVSDASVNYSP